VFVHEKIVLPQARDKTPSQVGDGRCHVDQLDTASEPEIPFLFDCLLARRRLLTMQRDSGRDNGNDDAHWALVSGYSTRVSSRGTEARRAHLRIIDRVNRSWAS